jgi:hypothetical protein
LSLAACSSTANGAACAPPNTGVDTQYIRIIVKKDLPARISDPRLHVLSDHSDSRGDPHLQRARLMLARNAVRQIKREIKSRAHKAAVFGFVRGVLHSRTRSGGCCVAFCGFYLTLKFLLLTAFVCFIELKSKF